MSIFLEPTFKYGNFSHRRGTLITMYAPTEIVKFEKGNCPFVIQNEKGEGATWFIEEYVNP